MFCPRCGHEQVSEEIRYCSRCGFPLGLVAQILVHGGGLPQLMEIYNKQKRWLTRAKGLKFGLAWFLFLTFLLAPIFAIAKVDRLAEVSAAFGFFGGLLIIFFSLIFLKNQTQASNVEKLGQAQKAGEYDAFRGKSNQNALPPQQSVPTSAYVPPTNSWKLLDTHGLASPGSVTEGTTKLLEKDE